MCAGRTAGRTYARIRRAAIARHGATVNSASQSAYGYYEGGGGGAGAGAVTIFAGGVVNLAATGLVGNISVWNVRTHKLERTIARHDALISIRFSPDGTQLATGDLKGNVDLWDAASGARVGTLGGQNGYVASETWSPDGREIAFVSFDGKYPQLFVVPLAGGEPRQLTRLDGAVYFVNWSPVELQ